MTRSTTPRPGVINRLVAIIKVRVFFHLRQLRSDAIERREVRQLDHQAVLDRWNCSRNRLTPGARRPAEVHSQNTIVAFLQAQELDLGSPTSNFTARR